MQPYKASYVTSVFLQLTKLNLKGQKIERELRDELAAAVPLSVSEADRKKIGKLEGDGAKMKVFCN